MGLVWQLVNGLLRTAILLALITFVALPEGRSTVSGAVGSEITELTTDLVDDGHEHSALELVFGHCEDGLDCSVIAAIFAQPSLIDVVTLEKQLSRPTVHELASLSWPYDAPPPRILI